MFNWQSVPSDSEVQWEKVFSGQENGIDIDGNCPVCGNSSLHRYYDGSEDRGALWEWCSSCYLYEHYSAKVRPWWNGKLDLSGLTLTAIPEALELARQRKGVDLGRRISPRLQNHERESQNILLAAIHNCSSNPNYKPLGSKSWKRDLLSKLKMYLSLPIRLE